MRYSRSRSAVGLPGQVQKIVILRRAPVALEIEAVAVIAGDQLIVVIDPDVDHVPVDEFRREPHPGQVRARFLVGSGGSVDKIVGFMEDKKVFHLALEFEPGAFFFRQGSRHLPSPIFPGLFFRGRPLSRFFPFGIRAGRIVFIDFNGVCRPSLEDC